MKLFRYTLPPLTKIHTGVLWKNKALDVSHQFPDYDASFFERGGIDELISFVRQNETELLPISEKAILIAPVAIPSKIVCAGLNYTEHQAEFGVKAMKEPSLFLKAPSAYSGPFDPIFNPPKAEKLDYEVELAVVIGKKASHIAIVEAVDYIAGYTLLCDVSERSFQTERGGQWTKGKSYDSFSPVGPYLVIPSSMSLPENTEIWLNVNGEPRQKAVLSQMIFSVPELVSYASQFMTLMPGDILSTGTPSGVAFSGEYPYLRVGDVVTMGCSSIGEQSHRIEQKIL